jgi:hypothetical protein
MTGKDLKKVVLNSGIKLSEIVEKSGIKQRTLYNLYEKEEIETHYLEKLSSAGLKLPNVAINDNNHVLNIEVLNTSLALLNRLVDNLERENKLLNSIVSKEISEGAYLTKEKHKKA